MVVEAALAQELKHRAILQQLPHLGTSEGRNLRSPWPRDHSPGQGKKLEPTHGIGPLRTVFFYKFDVQQRNLLSVCKHVTLECVLVIVSVSKFGWCFDMFA